MWGYLFFSPTRLPLTPAEVREDTVHPFTDAESVRATLEAHLPGITWDPEPASALVSGTVIEDDAQFEFSVREYEPPHATPGDGMRTLIVSIRCSGRIDSAPFAQRLCDAAGWIAFDDRAYLFQPHRPPMPSGSG